MRLFQRFLIPNSLTAGFILLPVYNFLAPRRGLPTSGLENLVYHLLAISLVVVSKYWLTCGILAVYLVFVLLTYTLLSQGRGFKNSFLFHKNRSGKGVKPLFFLDQPYIPSRAACP
ncbi:MAG: hypothetical protein KAR73_09435 [Spirochaetales bacterium]|nr:hypothetical protein [Spirochaetales bacterium]